MPEHDAGAEHCSHGTTLSEVALYPKDGDEIGRGRRILAAVAAPFSTNEGYAITEDTVVQLRQPETKLEDPMTEILRLGARRHLAQAVDIEATAFVDEHDVVVCAAAAHRDLLVQVLIR